MRKIAIVTAEPVESLIRVIRGQRVILDADLARVSGVTTKVLNQAVKRNRQRFPSDFLFQLTAEEVANLRSQFAISSSEANQSQIATSSDQGNRSQIVTGSQKHRDPRYLPYAFTEYGAFQAANVLNSDRAVQMGVFVVRAFVKMRETLVANRELAEKLAELERSLVARLDMHDHFITGIIKELHKLATPPEPARKQIGFQVRERPAVYRTKRKS
jgi:hypothetical protein